MQEPRQSDNKRKCKIAPYIYLQYSKISWK